MNKQNLQLAFTATILLLTVRYSAQVDVFNSRVITLGGEYKQTKHTGFYLKTNNLPGTTTLINNTSAFSFESDKGSALNIDGNYFMFDDNNFQIYNIDGLIYLGSYFGNMGSNHGGELNYSLSKYVTTSSQELLAVDNAVDFSKESRFWNFNLVDINASFGRKKLNAGVNLVWKIVGLTGPFTWFKDRQNQYTYINMQSASNSKILLGPNIAYRQSFKSLSLVALAGVNFCGNFNGDYEKRGDFKINYNPFLKATIFFGKQAGVYMGIKYDLIKAASKLDITDQSANPVKITAVNKMSVNQLELKLGIYLTGRKK